MHSRSQLSLFHTPTELERVAYRTEGVYSEASIQRTFDEHTPGHLHCRACMEARSVFAAPLSASLSFPQGVDCFFESRKIQASNHSLLDLAVIVCGLHAAA
jgi:hypothetical protein